MPRAAPGDGQKPGSLVLWLRLLPSQHDRDLGVLMSPCDGAVPCLSFFVPEVRGPDSTALLALHYPRGTFCFLLLLCDRGLQAAHVSFFARFYLARVSAGSTGPP